MSESRREPLRINILTIFPEMFRGVFSSSILGRAQGQGLLEIRLTDIRPYSESKHRGKQLSTPLARELAEEKELILLCGHYEGVDQRALDTCVDEEISIGDYILTGGETAAIVLVDCLSRFIPGVLGSSESPEEESFSDGLLEYPQYTRPRDLNGMTVPDVLLNGDHAKIREWRRRQSLACTARLRPDLLKTAELSDKDRKMLKEIEKEMSDSCSSEN